MSRTTRKVNPEGVMAVVGIFLLAALASLVARRLLAQNRAVHRESVALQMSWKRGDDHYGPNFIHLESHCFNNPEPGCFCSLDFKATTSKEFADYVGSFGTNKVPVTFHVDYDNNHQVVGAILESVGGWPENRFQINERALATGFRMLRNKPPSSGHFNNPADCFPRSVK